MNRRFSLLVVWVFFGVITSVAMFDAIFEWRKQWPPGSGVEKRMRRPGLDGTFLWKGNWTPAYEKWLVNRSWLVHGTGAIYRELTFPIGGRTPSNVVQGRNGFLFLKNTVETSDDRYYQERIQASVDVLNRFKKRYADQGIKMVVLLVPNAATLFPENLPRWTRRSDARDHFLDHLSSALREDGIPAFNPTEAMRATAEKGEPVFYRADNHWTYRGAQVATEELANFLATEGFARPTSPPLFEITWQDTVRNDGGILRMLGFRKESKLAAQYHEPTRVPVFSATNQPATSRVGWSGTSFSGFQSPEFFGNAWRAQIDKLDRPAKGSAFSAEWALKHYESSELPPPDFVVLELPEYHLVGSAEGGGDLDGVRLSHVALDNDQITPCAWKPVEVDGLKSVAGEPQKWTVDAREPSLVIELEEPVADLQIEIALSEVRSPSQVRLRGAKEPRLRCYDGGGLLKYRFTKKKPDTQWKISWNRVETGQTVEIGQVSRPKAAN